MPEGMKGKSFIERGTTPIEERYIGNAKMYTEAEKRAFLKCLSCKHALYRCNEEIL